MSFDVFADTLATENTASTLATQNDKEILRIPSFLYDMKI